MLELENISILDVLPPNFAADKNVSMAARAFDECLREVIGKIPNISIIPKLMRREIVSHTLCDILAWGFHVDFYQSDMSIELKQELIAKSLDWHTRKGTPSAVEEVVSTVFGEATVDEWFDYDGEPGFFRITTEGALPDKATLDRLVSAIYSVKNTRSWLEFILLLYKVPLTHNLNVGFWFDDIIEIGYPVPKPTIHTAYTGAVPEFDGIIEVFSGNRVRVKYNYILNGEWKLGQKPFVSYEIEGI